MSKYLLYLFPMKMDVEATQKQKRAFQIAAGRQSGLVAKELRDLKSISGRPFVEQIPSTVNYRRALVISEDRKYITEYAFFCLECGWVSGSPVRDKHGLRCYICGDEVGNMKKGGDYGGEDKGIQRRDG